MHRLARVCLAQAPALAVVVIDGLDLDQDRTEGARKQLADLIVGLMNADGERGHLGLTLEDPQDPGVLGVDPLADRLRVAVAIEQDHQHVLGNRTQHHAGRAEIDQQLAQGRVGRGRGDREAAHGLGHVRGHGRLQVGVIRRADRSVDGRHHRAAYTRELRDAFEKLEHV